MHIDPDMYSRQWNARSSFELTWHLCISRAFGSKLNNELRLELYDVPMKFAHKLIHGGQCTHAMNLQQALQINKKKEKKCSQTLKALLCTGLKINGSLKGRALHRPNSKLIFQKNAILGQWFVVTVMCAVEAVFMFSEAGLKLFTARHILQSCN